MLKFTSETLTALANAEVQLLGGYYTSRSQADQTDLAKAERRLFEALGGILRQELFRRAAAIEPAAESVALPGYLLMDLSDKQLHFVRVVFNQRAIANDVSNAVRSFNSCVFIGATLEQLRRRRQAQALEALLDEDDGGEGELIPEDEVINPVAKADI